MKGNPKILISLFLLLPAVVLVGTGALTLVFEMAAANQMLEAALAHPAGRVLLSPTLALGALLCCLAINLWRICRVHLEKVNAAWVISISIATVSNRMLKVICGLGLLVLLLGYAFVENFRILPR